MKRESSKIEVISLEIANPHVPTNGAEVVETQISKLPIEADVRSVHDGL